MDTVHDWQESSRGGGRQYCGSHCTATCRRNKRGEMVEFDLEGQVPEVKKVAGRDETYEYDYVC